MGSPPYPLHVSPTGQVAVVRPSGELDVAVVDRLDEVLARAAELAGSLVLVDLADVTFLDSSGLGALVRARKHADASGRRLLVAHAAPGPRKVLRLTGLLSVLEASADTLAEAEVQELLVRS